MTLNHRPHGLPPIIADLHCDTVLSMRNGVDISIRTNTGHIDLPRLIQGGVNLQVFACYVDPSTPKARCVETVDRLIDLIERLAIENNDKLAICHSAPEAREIIDGGRIAIFIGIENGHAIAESLENLDHFFARGVRYMTLTHNKSLSWCSSSADESCKRAGLSSFGKEVVRNMNRLGMIVDISHVSPEAVEDILAAGDTPVIASHSCAHALSQHSRNLTDDQIRAIAANKGMIGVIFCRDFLSEESAHRTGVYLKERMKDFTSWNDLIVEPHETEHIQQEMVRLRPFIEGWIKTLKETPVDVGTVADHIEHIASVGGVETVGLGSDYDGIPHPPDRLEDCSMIPTLLEELAGRGFSQSQIGMIAGENFLRVFEQVSNDATN